MTTELLKATCKTSYLHCANYGATETEKAFPGKSCGALGKLIEYHSVF